MYERMLHATRVIHHLWLPSHAVFECAAVLALPCGLRCLHSTHVHVPGHKVWCLYWPRAPACFDFMSECEWCGLRRGHHYEAAVAMGVYYGEFHSGHAMIHYNTSTVY